MTLNNTKPAASLKAFINGIIDYAGLFPPASLELGQALNNYISYMQSEYKYMLNKFIIPVNRLNELGSLIDIMKINTLIPLSVLGTGGDTVNGFRNNLLVDLENVKNFNEKYGSATGIDVFEMKLPKEVIESEGRSEIPGFMTMVSEEIEKTFKRNIPVFYEAHMNAEHLSEEYENIIIRTTESIASIERNCGFKLRTGGVVPEAFPPSEQIAFAIISCCEFGIPMKCTAGLHHPVRHFNDGVNSFMHGFINVFAASVLAYVCDLDETDITQILNEEDPFEFIFREDKLEYNEIEISADQIKEARGKFIVSYGSCSFDEPVDDLKTMELL